MAGKNVFGRLGVPHKGYPSIRQYWIARRAEKQREVAERVADIEAGEAFERSRRAEHYGAWITDRCRVGEMLAADSRELRHSYEDWAVSRRIRPESRQAWGRWMRSSYRQRPTRINGQTVRMYLGIAVKPHASENLTTAETDLIHDGS